VLPARSDTSAVRYSRIATKYTAIVALTLAFAAAHDFNNLWIHPTGNCNSWHNYKVMILCNTSPNIVLGKNGSNRQSHKSTMQEASKSNHIDIAAEIGTESEEKY